MSLVDSFDIEGSPCVLKGPSNHYESPPWTWTAPFTARHLCHRTGDMCVTWPESSVLVGSLVVRFDIEGSSCVLKGPGNQYELPAWTCTSPRPSCHLSHRTGDMCVTRPKSPVFMGSLVANFHVEGPYCILNEPNDQYEPRNCAVHSTASFL